ncbi:hypothetical protein CCH79_00001881 [Gambusia affinis]|uniref:Ig-like domain-containing protein n=1 Tax=Gambusia affinis TaxID=33528 RepID=A0A315VIK8_GAMAF|nr:hypothetical protein CCH79_00001881 [Gambusia affinis]
MMLYMEMHLSMNNPPAGSPSCSMEAAQNHTSLSLLCSWSGGLPSPSLRWTGDGIKAEQEETELQTNLQNSAAILLPSEGRIPNNSLFTCIGAHPVIKQQAECSTLELRDNMYPAVVGAAVGGMLFAAIPTVLLLVFIIRNRDSNPRLHAMLFGSQHSQSRENINFPEDEVVADSDGGLENTTGSGKKKYNFSRTKGIIYTRRRQASPTAVTLMKSVPPTGLLKKPVDRKP